MSHARTVRTSAAGQPQEPRGAVQLSGRYRRSAIFPVLIAAALPLALPLAALAQIEEIVVTARKKDETLLDVPVAVEAITAEEIERKGITDIARLAEQSASIKFDQGSSRQDTRLSIRGLSPTRGRQNAAILVDGVDISSEAISTSGGSILINQRLLSVARIDTIKGPQSALWGRSAFNGAINFVTKDPPETLAGEIRVDGNDEDQYQLFGEVGMPILEEKLGVMLNGGWWDKDGFYDNSLTGDNIGSEEGYGFSVKTKSDFGNGLVVSGRAYYEHYEYGQSPEAFLGFNKVLVEPDGAFTPNTDPRVAGQTALFCLPQLLGPSAITDQLFNQAMYDRYVRTSLDPNNPAIGDGPHCQRLVPVFAGQVPDGDQLQATLSTNPFDPGNDYPGLEGDTIRLSLVAEWELEKGTFTSVTGYTHDDNTENQDFARFSVRNPASPFLDDNVNTFQSRGDKLTRQFQQEIRYATNFDGPVNMTLGGTYWEEDVSNESRSLTMQAAGSYCFYSSGNLNDITAGSFAVNPPCPGYTELPIQQFVGPGGVSFLDPAETAVYNGIEGYTRDSPVDRNTEHRSIYGLIQIKATENTSVDLEGRYSHEELEVIGPVFLNPAATGGPGSWSICGAPGRPCDLAYLQRAPGTLNGNDLGGPYWNLANFQRTYDVWKGITDRTATAAPVKNQALIDAIPAKCLENPVVQQRLQAIDDEIALAAEEGRDPKDPQFDLFNPFCLSSLERTDDWFSPKITVSHKPNENTNVYASWAHSEKPGGYGLFTVGSSGLREDLSAFESEQMETWEVGAKSRLLDGTLSIEGALFFNDYTDKQVLVQGLGPDGRAVSKIDNAPAEVLGAELSAQWAPDATFLGGNWSVTGAYLFIDGEYKDYIDIATSENNIALAGNCTPAVLEEIVIVSDPLTGQGTVQELARAACAISFDGNKLERAPRHSFVGNVGYTVPVGDTLDGIAEITGQWKDKQYIEYTNESWLGAYWNLDFRAGIRSDKWEVIGYVENVLDDDAIRSASNQPGLGCCFALGVSVDLGGTFGGVGSTAEVPNARAAFLTQPRTIGLRARYSFGGE